MTPGDPRHGTTCGYHAGCHDICCRAAMARYEKQGRLARLSGGRAVPALGAKRRLQALMALGWSSTEIATAANLPDRNHVFRILNGQKGKPTTWLERSTYEWVCDVYERLCMTLPTSPYANRVKTQARARGCLPPLVWDDIDDPDEQPVDGSLSTTEIAADPVVVERILAGEWSLASTPAERAEVCRRWVARGRSTYELTQITGWRIERYYRKAA